MTMDFWLGYCLGVLSLIALAVVVHLRQCVKAPEMTSQDREFIDHRPVDLTFVNTDKQARQMAAHLLKRARKDIH